MVARPRPLGPRTDWLRDKNQKYMQSVCEDNVWNRVQTLNPVMKHQTGGTHNVRTAWVDGARPARLVKQSGLRCRNRWNFCSVLFFLKLLEDIMGFCLFLLWHSAVWLILVGKLVGTKQKENKKRRLDWSPWVLLCPAPSSGRQNWCGSHRWLT